MFSIWDNQTHDYKHSGANEKNREDAIDGALHFLLFGDAIEGMNLETVLKMSCTEKETIINSFELEVHEHTKLKVL